MICQTENSSLLSLASGAQMRADDPASLKDIIDEIQKQSNKRDPTAIS
jgi:nucleolar MIF4G domain-containing protein 1